MQCNIDARGKAVRMIMGLIMLLVAVVLAALLWLDVLASNWWWAGVGGFAVAAGIGVVEARAGWCVVRAAGFRTPV